MGLEIHDSLGKMHSIVKSGKHPVRFILFPKSNNPMLLTGIEKTVSRLCYSSSRPHSEFVRAGSSPQLRPRRTCLSSMGFNHYSLNVSNKKLNMLFKFTEVRISIWRERRHLDRIGWSLTLELLFFCKAQLG